MAAYTPAIGQQAATRNARPLTAGRIRQVLRIKAGWQGNAHAVRPAGRPAITEAQWDRLSRLLAWALDDARGLGSYDAVAIIAASDDVLLWLFGVDSDNLSKAEASALIDWLKAPDKWEPGPYAAAEAGEVLDAARKDKE